MPVVGDLATLVLGHRQAVATAQREAWRLPDEWFIIGLLAAVCNDKVRLGRFKRSCFEAFRLNEEDAAACIERWWRTVIARRAAALAPVVREQAGQSTERTAVEVAFNGISMSDGSVCAGGPPEEQSHDPNVAHLAMRCPSTASAAAPEAVIGAPAAFADSSATQADQPAEGTAVEFASTGANMPGGSVCYGGPPEEQVHDPSVAQFAACCPPMASEAGPEAVIGAPAAFAHSSAAQPIVKAEAAQPTERTAVEVAFNGASMPDGSGCDGRPLEEQVHDAKVAHLAVCCPSKAGEAGPEAVTGAPAAFADSSDTQMAEDRPAEEQRTAVASVGAASAASGSLGNQGSGPPARSASASIAAALRLGGATPSPRSSRSGGNGRASPVAALANARAGIVSRSASAARASSPAARNAGVPRDFATAMPAAASGLAGNAARSSSVCANVAAGTRSTGSSPSGGEDGRCRGVRGDNPYRRKWNPRLAAAQRKEREEQTRAQVQRLQDVQGRKDAAAREEEADLVSRATAFDLPPPAPVSETATRHAASPYGGTGQEVTAVLAEALGPTLCPSKRCRGTEDCGAGCDDDPLSAEYRGSARAGFSLSAPTEKAAPMPRPIGNTSCRLPCSGERGSSTAASELTMSMGATQLPAPAAAPAALAPATRRADIVESGGELGAAAADPVAPLSSCEPIDGTAQPSAARRSMAEIRAAAERRMAQRGLIGTSGARGGGSMTQASAQLAAEPYGGMPVDAPLPDCTAGGGGVSLGDDGLPCVVGGVGPDVGDRGMSEIRAIAERRSRLNGRGPSGSRAGGTPRTPRAINGSGAADVAGESTTPSGGVFRPAHAYHSRAGGGGLAEALGLRYGRPPPDKAGRPASSGGEATMMPP